VDELLQWSERQREGEFARAPQKIRAPGRHVRLHVVRSSIVLVVLEPFAQLQVLFSGRRPLPTMGAQQSSASSATAPLPLPLVVIDPQHLLLLTSQLADFPSQTTPAIVGTTTPRAGAANLAAPRSLWRLNPLCARFLERLLPHCVLAFWMEAPQADARHAADMLATISPEVRKRLLFFWSLEQCNGTAAPSLSPLQATSPRALAGNGVPPSRKSLQTIWDAFPQFGAHNTLLFEASPAVPEGTRAADAGQNRLVVPACYTRSTPDVALSTANSSASTSFSFATPVTLSGSNPLEGAFLFLLPQLSRLPDVRAFLQRLVSPLPPRPPLSPADSARLADRLTQLHDPSEEFRPLLLAAAGGHCIFSRLPSAVMRLIFKHVSPFETPQPCSRGNTCGRRTYRHHPRGPPPTPAAGVPSPTTPGGVSAPVLAAAVRHLQKPLPDCGCSFKPCLQCGRLTHGVTPLQVGHHTLFPASPSFALVSPLNTYCSSIPALSVASYGATASVLRLSLPGLLPTSAVLSPGSCTELAHPFCGIIAFFICCSNARRCLLIVLWLPATRQRQRHCLSCWSGASCILLHSLPTSALLPLQLQATHCASISLPVARHSAF
jgi:hypothetical protein